MTVEITVRGSAEQRYAAEVARVALAAEVQGEDRADVLAEATAAHAAITSALSALAESGSVARWSADAVRVMAQRQWLPDGARGALTQTARLEVQAQFVDFEALSSFVDAWSADERVEIGHVGWDLTEEHRHEHTAHVRAAAVADAVAKAQAYADAVDAGTVSPTHLADPGLLSPGEPQPRAMMAMSADAAYGSTLELVPDEIVVRCEVDARFVAG